MSKTSDRRFIVRLAMSLAAASGLVLAVLSPAVPAAAGAGAAGSPEATPVKSQPAVTVAPMGSRAATLTAQARGGKSRSAASAVQRPDRASDKVQPLAARSFWELQLNLCNSGVAGCFSNGDALYEGGDLIYYLAPDLVTLNEICSSDLPNYLQPSLAEAWPGDWTYYSFYPAINKSTGAPISCTGGRGSYGNAVLGRVPAALWQGVNAWAGEYTAQDSGNEKRTFVCAYAVGDHMGCATHLTSASEPIALSQCKALMFNAVPYIRSQEGLSNKTVVGGDFNMEYDTADPENVQNCVPSGNTRKGDNDVQHVIFTNDFAFVGTNKYGLTHTDHDGFLVRLTKP
jgi:endonuclease/exonuclease/phosphatase family metal-dependent hydrolase